MAGRRVSEEPEFGTPVPEEPKGGRNAPSSYWMKVVQHAKTHEGLWIPLLNSPITESRLRNITQQMRNHPGAGRIPVALREPGMQTKIAQRQFWFRYDRPQALRKVG
jgi:hypothetical protein